MKKKSTDLGLIIPSKIRIAGMTFYKRGNQVVGRVSESNEKRSNTPSQFDVHSTSDCLPEFCIAGQ